MAYVDKANDRFAAARTKSEEDKVLQETGCKGSYSLRQLPTHDRYLNTPVEPMHVIKNVSERLVKLVSGVSDSFKEKKPERDFLVLGVEKRRENINCRLHHFV